MKATIGVDNIGKVTRPDVSGEVYFAWVDGREFLFAPTVEGVREAIRQHICNPARPGHLTRVTSLTLRKVNVVSLTEEQLTKLRALFVERARGEVLAELADMVHAYEGVTGKLPPGFKGFYKAPKGKKHKHLFPGARASYGDRWYSYDGPGDPVELFGPKFQVTPLDPPEATTDWPKGPLSKTPNPRYLGHWDKSYTHSLTSGDIAMSYSSGNEFLLHGFPLFFYEGEEEMDTTALLAEVQGWEGEESKAAWAERQRRAEEYEVNKRKEADERGELIRQFFHGPPTTPTTGTPTV